MTNTKNSAQVFALLESCLNIGAFADQIPDSELCGGFLTTQERAELSARNKAWTAEAQTASAKNMFARVVRQLNKRPCAMALSQARLDMYWEDRDAWVNCQPKFKALHPDDWHMGTEDEWTQLYDEHMARVEQRWWHGTKEMCRFFQLPGGCREGVNCQYSHDISETCSIVSDGIHRDINGEPEICRYFNLPGGCTKEKDGKGPCPYKHIAGVVPEQEICRFFNSPRGCRSGDACIFKHQKVAPVEKDWRGAATGAVPWRPTTAMASAGAKFAILPKVTEDGWEVASSKKLPAHSGFKRPAFSK
jgi:hypothetical protein